MLNECECEENMVAGWWFGVFFHMLGETVSTDLLRGVETTNQDNIHNIYIYICILC